VIDELLPGDQVAHTATRRLGHVLELGTRWYGLTVALVRYDEPAMLGFPIDTRWVPRTLLRRVDPVPD
jgi:hypothetical protein